MAPSKKIYNEAVSISTEYLGLAGDRFLRRQIITHLEKKPEDLTPKDLTKLVHWVKITFSLLTDNQQLVESYANELNSLSSSKPRKAKLDNGGNS